MTDTGTLLARTWRIDRVFHREKLTRDVIRDQQLLTYVMLLVLFDIFMMFLYYGVRHPSHINVFHAVVHLSVAFTQLFPGQIVLKPAFGDDNEDVKVCAYDNLLPFIIIIGLPNGIAMLACAYIAFKVQSVG